MKYNLHPECTLKFVENQEGNSIDETSQLNEDKTLNENSA